MLNGKQTKKEVYSIYAPDHDTTFVMERCCTEGELLWLEVKGFYHGEPTDCDNKTFYGHLKANYSGGDMILNRKQAKRLIKFGRRIWNSLTRDEQESYFNDTGTYGFVETLLSLFHINPNDLNTREFELLHRAIIGW